MADVFISCTHADQERVRSIAERLSSLGYSVSWQRDTDASAQIEAARAVIAAWSSEARNSTQMCAEASKALDSGKLLHVRLDGSEPPPPFDPTQIADLSNDRAEWGPLEAALAKLVREGATASSAPMVGPMATANAAGAPKVITVALATSLIAYAGALAESRNGVMSPDQLQLAMTGMIGVAGACVVLCIHRLLTIRRAGS